MPTHADLLREAADTLDNTGSMTGLYQRQRELADKLRQAADEIDPPPKPEVQEYYVLYKVQWQPESADTDPPTDRDHELRWEDDRIIGYGLEEIGSLAQVALTVDNALVIAAAGNA